MDFVSTIIAIFVLSLASLQSAISISPALILTPYLDHNKTEARQQSLVNPALFLNKTSHSGFLTVDPQYKSNLFFWYFPVEDKHVEQTPLIVWLQGGPGSTSLFGLFDEIGPFEYANGELKARKHAWTNEHSVLFIDNPVGAGYSFTDSDLGYARSEKNYTDNLYNGLQQFLTIFPELRKAPLFIAGESYAGRYVPSLASLILETTPASKKINLGINLQGIIMGNPVMDREALGNYSAVFYQWGLVDSQGVLAVKPLEEQYWRALEQGNNELAYQLHDKVLDKLMDISMQQQLYNVLVDNYHLEGFEQYLSQDSVKEALHVGQINFSARNQTVANKLIPDFLNEPAEMQKLLEAYKVLIYCGQLDLASPCASNAEARRKWNWSRRAEFLNAPRAPWWYNETVAGYVKSGGNLMEALVRGAGHLAPIDKPAEVLKLVSSFIKDVDMELPPNYTPNKNNTPVLPYSKDDIVHTTQSPTANKNVSIPEQSEVTTQSPIASKNVSKSVIKKVTNSNKTEQPEIILDVTHSNKTEQPKVATKDTKSNKSDLSGNKSNLLPTATPIVTEVNSGVSGGTTASIILNIVLILVVVCGAFFYYRLKKRSRDLLYRNIDTNSEEIFLT